MSNPINRRNFVKTLCVSPIALKFLGCQSTKNPTDSGNVGLGEWASGTTDIISVPYPDDSIFSTEVCILQLTKATTKGPCYFQDDTGEDISTGLSGLPMQLCLRLIDSNCNPLQGYIIEVWHCDINGVYSGDTSDSDNSENFSSDFCTGANAAAKQSSWYRGQLTTDNNGRVNFKSCFPGWYPGRTVHIHFAVSDGNGSRIVSQFCFTDQLAAEIYTTHELYTARGEQDTPLSSGQDAVFPSFDYENFLLQTSQNSDGTLLAYGTIQIG